MLSPSQFRLQTGEEQHDGHPGQSDTTRFPDYREWIERLVHDGGPKIGVCE